MPTQYVKMYKEGNMERIPEDRVKRFQEHGWSIEPEVKSSSKNKIKASAKVTSESKTEPWDPLTGESWADSEESMSVEDELPTDEEN